MASTLDQLHVHTYADAFGSWHAEIRVDGDSPRRPAASVLARQAVREQLEARAPRGTEVVFRLVRMRSSEIASGWVHHFAEVDC